jgi:hypothetical protein
MSIALQRSIRIRAGLALVVCMAYLGMVILPDLANFPLQDLIDLSKLIPIGFTLMVLVLSIRSLIDPVTSPMRSLLLLGVLESTLVIAFLVGLFAGMTYTDNGLDGTSRWIAFYVSVFHLIPIVTIPVVLCRLLLANLWR